MKYSYKEMLITAKSNGMASEKTMWAGVDSINEMLCIIEETQPDVYWRFMREQHGILYGNHYGEDFAMQDVEQLSYTDKSGKKHTGCHWTCSQIEDATRSMQFPAGTNKWDKYVAFNAAYSDLCKDLEETEILKIGFSLYFADEDWPTNTKIWDYMSCRYAAE